MPMDHAIIFFLHFIQFHTPDLGGTATTSEVVQSILREIHDNSSDSD